MQAPLLVVLSFLYMGNSFQFSSFINKQRFTFNRQLLKMQDDFANNCVIKVVGVGGGGGNAIVRMLETGVGGVEFSVMNTDTLSI